MGMICLVVTEHDWKPLKHPSEAANKHIVVMDWYFKSLDTNITHFPHFKVTKTTEDEAAQQTDVCLHHPNCIMSVDREICVVWHMELLRIECLHHIQLIWSLLFESLILNVAENYFKIGSQVLRCFEREALVKGRITFSSYAAFISGIDHQTMLIGGDSAQHIILLHVEEKIYLLSCHSYSMHTLNTSISHNIHTNLKLRQAKVDTLIKWSEMLIVLVMSLCVSLSLSLRPPLSRLPCLIMTRRGCQGATSGLPTHLAGGTSHLTISWKR